MEIHSGTLVNIVNSFSGGIDFRRQILTFKVDPRTEKVTIFIMAVDT